jgi:hypothetical protein
MICPRGYGQPSTPQGQIAGSLFVSAQQLMPQCEHLPTGSSFLKSNAFIFDILKLSKGISHETTLIEQQFTLHLKTLNLIFEFLHFAVNVVAVF